MISLLSATERLAQFIPDSPFATLTPYSSVLASLVNDCGYSESIALHLALFVYAEDLNSGLTAPQAKLSLQPRMAAS